MMLTLSHVTKTFSSGFYPILNDVSITFKTGEYCVLIGSNGSGKSTLLRTIAGEYTPDCGEIQILAGAQIASVVQDVNLGTIPDMSLLENVVLSRLRHQKARLMPYALRQKEALSIIQSLNMNLERYLHTPLKCLSGGQRQMIATLMAIQSQPDILLLDEHTSALDPKTQQTLMTYTNEAIQAQRLLTLMVTHKLDDALRYGNRLIMLHQGRVVFDVADEEKSALSIEQLLALFHQYEDQTLAESSDEQ